MGYLLRIISGRTLPEFIASKLGHDLEHRTSSSFYDSAERTLLLERLRTLNDPLEVDRLANQHREEIMQHYRKTGYSSAQACLLELSIALQQNPYYQAWLESRGH